MRFTAALLAAALLPAMALGQLKPGDFVATGPAQAKKIALTFDDGPGPHTEKYLDLLDRYGVKATFFFLGEQTKYRPAIAKKVAERGHEIANHTYDHANYLKRHRAAVEKHGDGDAAVAAVRKELADDMAKSRKIIEAATGETLTLLRMPHGVDRPWVKEAAKQTGFILANWTYGGDWLGAPQAELERAYVKAIKPGAILLFHDGGSRREKSLALTEAVLKAARENGYEIVTLGELIGTTAQP